MNIRDALQRPTSDSEKKQSVKEAEIRLAAFFAEHNLAFHLSDHLTDVIGKCFTDSAIAKDLTLNRTKCTSIVKNIIANVESTETINNLRHLPFSILVDESTDITDHKFMCALVRYMSPTTGRVRTELLELILLDATDCSAAKMYDAFKNCLVSKNIPLNNILGLASDGANVMVGKHNSFFSHLTKDVPSVILMRCLCHSSALVAGKACEKLPRGPEELLRSISTYCSGSAKRCSQLTEMQEYFHMERKKILKLASTRWLSMHQCVSRILEYWVVLISYFRVAVVEDKLLSAENILRSMENSYTKAYLLFLKYVLNILNKFNALFQSRTILIHKISDASENILKEFLTHFIKTDVLNNVQLHTINVDDHNNFLQNDRVFLGTECEDYINNFNSEVVTEIKNKCLEFFIQAAIEIKKRLPINNLFFKQLKFIDPKIALTDGTDINFKVLIETFNKPFDINELTMEWRRLKVLINQEQKKELISLDVEEFWHQISKLEDYSEVLMYKNLADLAKLCLCLPHSNAESERIFSIVTDVKTKKRNRLGDDTLNSISVIRSSFGAKNIDCTNFEVTKEHLRLHNAKTLYKK